MGRFASLLILLIAPGLALGQSELKTYRVRPLEFEVGVPDGWQSQQDNTGMVARGPGAGFMVSREPFLGTEDGFADAWAKQLSEAGIAAEVKKEKIGRHLGWHAAWVAEEAKRSIQVWRLYVPANEMLYNISFSAKQGTDLEALVDAVLGSFKCTGAAASLKFKRESETLSTAVYVKLPLGYEKQPRGVSLGGGMQGGFVKTIPGYTEPHVAGFIATRQYDARRPYRHGGGTVQGGDTKKLVDITWDLAEREASKVLKKPKKKGARYKGLKGYSLEARILDKKGFPKHVWVFGGKYKSDSIVITIIVDSREARMYGDMLKQICAQITVKK